MRLREFEMPRSQRRKREPSMQLLAASTLSERTLKLVIRCYAEDRLPTEAAKLCGISHVTANRLYHHIRRRLLDVGVFKTEERFWEDVEWLEEETDW